MNRSTLAQARAQEIFAFIIMRDNRLGEAPSAPNPGLAVGSNIGNSSFITYSRPLKRHDQVFSRFVSYQFRTILFPYYLLAG